MRVEVYYNLHKNLFSVRHKGKVIMHTYDVQITNPTFVVRPSGRAKVLAEGRKNVHAFVRGDMSEEVLGLSNGIAVTYNPYKYSCFVNKDTEEPVYQSKVAILHKPTVGSPTITAY